MINTLFVTGGSGFVGRSVISELLMRGYGVRALVNRRPIQAKGEVQSIPGSLFDSASLDAAMAGCSAIIHLVGIIQEKPSQDITFDRMHRQATENVVAAAKRNAISRLIHMSALGTRADAASQYHGSKYAAEQAVRAGIEHWTILRPSLIHGPDGDFMKMERRWALGKAAPYLFMPYFGAGILGSGGAGRLQPVFVGDVARAFVEALTNDRSINRCYELAGAEQMTWPQFHRTACRAIIGKTRPVLAIPAWYAKMLTYLVPASWLPFSRDQVLMSQEDNTTDSTAFESDFGWQARSFSATVGEYSALLPSDTRNSTVV